MAQQDKSTEPVARVLTFGTDVLEFSYSLEHKRVQSATLANRGGYNYGNVRSVQLLNEPAGQLTVIVRDPRASTREGRFVECPPAELAEALEMIIAQEQAELEKQKALVERLERARAALQPNGKGPYR